MIQSYEECRVKLHKVILGIFDIRNMLMGLTQILLIKEGQTM